MSGEDPSSLKLAVDVTASDVWAALLDEPELWAERVLRETLTAAGLRVQSAEGFALSLLFSDDAQIRQLNRRFRAKDKPTNVLSFPQNLKSGLLGDIAFAFETVRREAGEGGKPFLDHLTHLLVHGILHLIGFTHDDDDAARRMETVEIAVLKRLGIPDPYMERITA